VSKTIACSSLTPGDWNDFRFDTGYGTGDAMLTKTGSLWRLSITHSGAGTGTTVHVSNAGNRTTALCLVYTKNDYAEVYTDYNGRWRPGTTYPLYYCNMIGPWEIPVTELSWTSGEYYSTAPGVKMTSPGDYHAGYIPVRGGVSTTISVWCKQVDCDASRLPRLVVWGNGLGDALNSSQVDIKANDSSWEQLSVTFTPAQDGVVVVAYRHQDYYCLADYPTGGSYSSGPTHL